MNGNAQLAALTDEALAPLFWRPARIGVQSAWYGHVPFAHWLVAAHRPRSIVELGTHHGVSYAAFCEAVLRERLDTRCMAIDSWEGDEHAGFYGDEVYTELKRFHDQRYTGFSTLHRARFDAALDVVPDGSIDLLHIDGRHRHADVLADFASWQVKLSPRAVVLFHDTNVRQGDFGVWRLWQDLAARGATFEFLHAHGLGVLAHGQEVTGAVAALCGGLDAAGTNIVRERFATLGERWVAAADLDEQRQVAARLDADLKATREWAETAQAEVNKLFPLYKDLVEHHRAARANLAQARYDIAARDLAQQEAAARQAREAAARDAAQAEELATRDAELAAQRAAAAAAAGAAELAARASKLAAELSAARETIAARDVALAAAHDAWHFAVRLLDDARTQIRLLEESRATLLRSTAWRLTAPVRLALDLARGRGVRLSVAPAALAGPSGPLPEPPVPPGLLAPDPAPPAPALPEIPPEPPGQEAPPAPETVALPSSAAALPAPASEAASAPATPAAPSPATRPRALFISGEDHTPGTIYRVERYVATARECGFDARWMTAAPVGPEDLAGQRLVVLWRVPHSAHVQGIIHVAHEQGATVIFDVDDLMFRPEMAVIDIIDGIRSQKFSELDTQAFFARIGRTLKACDLVTCPTAELAHHARLMGRPAYVLPNGFDDASHAVSRRARREWRMFADDLLRIGYAAGSRTHQRDFAVAAPAILRILQENDRVRLTLFRDPNGGEGVILLDEFPEFAPVADRIEWRNMVSLPDLPKELARFAVNIAPLEPENPFCAAKSELKYFEAALVGVPTIASPAGPFRRAVIEGVTGHIATTTDDWYAKLTTLLADAELRARMADAAYHDSLAHFGPPARAQAFSLMLAQIEGGAAGAAAFERQRYRDALPRLQPPQVPASDILFHQDRMQDAGVTVIIPVYKYADYVPEALASVAAQTLPLLDLVVIDDASPDDSREMVLDWVNANANRFNRIVVLRHRENAGLGFGRNSGFAQADTPYVLPLDADNRLRPQACARLLAELEDSTASFAYPLIQQFGDATDVFGDEAYSTLRLQRGNYIDAMALVRKSAWAAAGGYDHVQYGWEDFDFWCRLAERGYYGVQIPEILADYRVHKASMLHTMTEIRDHRDDLVTDLMARHPWLDLVKKQK